MPGFFMPHKNDLIPPQTPDPRPASLEIIPCKNGISSRRWNPAFARCLDFYVSKVTQELKK